MIKNKITPEIIDKFRETIRETVETGNEYAFYICKDSKGNLSPTSIIKGGHARIEMGRSKCPFKTQGNFHTHADVSNVKRFVLKDRHVSQEIVRRFVLELSKREGIPITTPSHADVLSALLNKCFRRTEGTVCVGSDADINRVDCWTAKEESKEKCREAMYGFESEFKPIPPKDWIKPLFDKEVIEL